MWKSRFKSSVAFLSSLDAIMSSTSVDRPVNSAQPAADHMINMVSAHFPFKCLCYVLNVLFSRLSLKYFCAEAHIFRASKCFVQNHPFISSPSQQRPGWRCWRQWRRWRRCRTHNSTTSKLPLIVSGRWDHDKQIKTVLLFCLYIFFVHWLSNISQANPQDSWQLLV